MSHHPYLLDIVLGDDLVATRATTTATGATTTTTTTATTGAHLARYVSA